MKDSASVAFARGLRIHGTSGGYYDFGTRSAGRSRQRSRYFPPFLGLPPSWVIGNLLTRLSPATSMLRAALAGALLVLGLLLWLISKALVSEVHFTWSIISSLVIAAVAMLMGTAFFVKRRHGVPQKTGEVLQLDQMQLDGPPEEIEEPETEARLRRWAKAAVAVAVLLTVLLSLLSWRGAQQATETADWVAHTHEVMTVLESALRHSLDVETGGRGFAETGSVQFLEPYESGRPAVVQDLHALRLLLVTPDQLRA